MFCIPELGILASLPVRSMLFSIRDVLHHPCSCRFHNPLLPRSATYAPGTYRTTICHPLGGIHTQARRFEAIDLDPASCVSTSRFLSTLCNRLTYGGRRASLQLLERKATPACRSNIVSLKTLCAMQPSHIQMRAPDSRPLPRSMSQCKSSSFNFDGTQQRDGGSLTAKKETATKTIMFSGLER